MLCREEQSKNVRAASSFTPSGISIFCSDAQPLNASAPIVSTLSGIVTSAREEQP